MILLLEEDCHATDKKHNKEESTITLLLVEGRNNATDEGDFQHERW